MKRFIPCLLLGLLAGIAAGQLLPESSLRILSRVTSPFKDTGMRKSSVPEPVASAVAMEQGVAGVATPSGDSRPPSLLEEYRRLSSLLHRDARLEVFRYGGIGDDFAAVFELTPVERHQVDQLRLYIEARLAALRLSHCALDGVTAEGVKMHVDPFPAEGEALGLEMRRTLEGILGPRRFAELLATGDVDRPGVFEGMGRAFVTYELQPGDRQDASTSYSTDLSTDTILKKVTCSLGYLRRTEPDLHARLLVLHPELATPAVAGNPQG